MKIQELKEKLAKGEKIKLIDIREKEELERGDVIKGAVNIPMGRVFVEASPGNLPKNEQLVTVCKTGGRCQVLVRELRERGYDIDYLEGGMEEWKKFNK